MLLIAWNSIVSSSFAKIWVLFGVETGMSFEEYNFEFGIGEGEVVAQNGGGEAEVWVAYFLFSFFNWYQGYIYGFVAGIELVVFKN